jgi:hypothetical protein
MKSKGFWVVFLLRAAVGHVINPAISICNWQVIIGSIGLKISENFVKLIIK